MNDIGLRDYQRRIDRWVREAPFDGFREVEIFSKRWWERDQDEFLDRILAAYDEIYRGDNRQQT